MSKKFRVIYFTMVGLVPDGKNGGSICCRNHLERIAADPKIECLAYLVGAEAAAEASIAYAQSITSKVTYFPLSNQHFTIDSPPADASYMSRKWPFMHELDGIGQRTVRHNIASKIRDDKPDAIVIDYLYSALFIDHLFSMDIPVVVITLNREGEFYREMRSRNAQFYGTPASLLAEVRLRLFEMNLYRKSAAVASIGRFDLPRVPFSDVKARWISPYLDPSPDRWSFTESNSFFFVGNHNHYPNRMAIEWLATRFCPELLRIEPKARVSVLGMEIHEAPEAWKAANLDFIGYGNEEMAAYLFRTAAALIAPIANNFGAKFKILEAASYGTPFIATSAAMSGTSFLPDVPIFDLENPREAVSLAVQLQSQSHSTRLHRYISHKLGIMPRPKAELGEICFNLYHD